MENRCCDAAGTDDCRCEQERWVRVSERLPREGVVVLWYVPSDKFWPVVSAKLDGGTLNWGGDLNMSMKGVEYWTPIPELPRPRAL